MRTAPIAAALALSLLLAAPAGAHKPYLSDGQYGDADSAFVMDDFLVSIVVYHEVLCDRQQLWLTFEGEAGKPLWVQLGMPKLQRLAAQRPVAAVIGPGLDAPPEGFPYAVAEGEGVWLIEAAVGAALEEFSEPFSQTESFVIGNLDDVPLPASGTFRVVAWSPERLTGKLWLAVGTVEDFSDLTDPDAFYDTIQRVRAFHEQAGEVDQVEQVCPAPAPEEPPDADPGAAVDAGPPSAGGGGCAGGGLPLDGAALALLLLAVRRRAPACPQR